MPELTRAYLHTYKRPARHDRGERPCVNGSLCVALTLRGDIMDLTGEERTNSLVNSVARGAMAYQLNGRVVYTNAPPGSSAAAAAAAAENADPKGAGGGGGRTRAAGGGGAGGGGGGGISQSYVCREFLLPDQETEFLKHRVLPPYHQVCVMCEIFATNYFYQEYRRKNQEPRFCLQTFAVIVDTPGEYAKGACLPLSANKKMTGIMYPFPDFTVNRYRWTTDDAGQPYIKELNTDFH